MVILLLMTPGCEGSSRGRASGDESEPRPRLRSVTYEGDVRHSPALKIAHRELGTQMRPEERHPAPCALPPAPIQLSWGGPATKPAPGRFALCCFSRFHFLHLDEAFALTSC